MSDRPLVQLILTRIREFMREPDHLFWVLVFPILLAAGLGLAFRNRPAEILKVAVVSAELERLEEPPRIAASAAAAESTPHCSGVDALKTVNCLSLASASCSAAGPIAHPMRQPVQERVFPAPLSVSVRSPIPGSVASLTCMAGSKTMCS